MPLTITLVLLFAAACQESTGVDVAADEHAREASEREGHDDHEEGEGHEGEDGHDEEEGVVRLSAEAVARSGIVVETVRSVSLSAIVTIPAEVQLNPETLAHVSSLVDGQIREVFASVGDRVEAGQRLVEVRSIELGQARADLQQSRAILDVAEAEFERQERLRGSGIASERTFLAAQGAFRVAEARREASQARLEVFGLRGGRGPDMEMDSPIAGEILDRHATRGESISPTDTLFVIADLSRVWVLGRVYEQDIVSVSAGDRATLTLLGLPGRRFEGRVDWVATALEEQTRTLPVRVELDNPEGSLRPGMFGSLLLEPSQAAATTPAVPEEAVQTYQEGSVVFVPEPEEPGEYRAVAVVTGERAGGLVSVIEGLSPGDQVVVGGAFVLKSQLVRSELGEGHAH